MEFCRKHKKQKFLYPKNCRNNTADRAYAICKISKAEIGYLSDATNLRLHLIRFHPEKEQCKFLHRHKMKYFMSDVQKTFLFT